MKGDEKTQKSQLISNALSEETGVLSASPEPSTLVIISSLIVCSRSAGENPACRANSAALLHRGARHCGTGRDLWPGLQPFRETLWDLKVDRGNVSK